jgi:hypothetical protein
MMIVMIINYEVCGRTPSQAIFKLFPRDEVTE